jgi:hypothetical protein
VHETAQLERHLASVVAKLVRLGTKGACLAGVGGEERFGDRWQRGQDVADLYSRKRDIGRGSLLGEELAAEGTFQQGTQQLGPALMGSLAYA